MIYGIDLGTTNSLIGGHEKFLSDVVPSIVDIKGGIAGKALVGRTDVKRSFKIDISCGNEGLMSVRCSKEVLLELVDEANAIIAEHNRSNPDDRWDRVKDVVISVPAYFSDNQRAATKKAAEAAGLNVVRLINEPTAAALLVGQHKEGIYAVFDLGGGTFDISIIDTTNGRADVRAKDGCIVGGDDLDYFIRAHIKSECELKEHLLNAQLDEKLRLIAREAKETVQKQGSYTCSMSEFNCNKKYKLDEDTYKAAMKSIFGECITKFKNILKTAIYPGEDFGVVLVGGSTHCPYLREWITEEIGKKPIDYPYSPDEIVAQGAAYYAKLIEDGVVDEKVTDVTDRLSIAKADGTVTEIIPANAPLPISGDVTLYNPKETDVIQVLLCQGESNFSSENEVIGSMSYNYGRVMKEYEGMIYICADVDASGFIKLSVSDIMGRTKEIEIDRTKARVNK